MIDLRLAHVRGAIWLTGTAAILAGFPAHAQTAPSDGAASETSEIIVTATKRAERLQDVAASVAVVAADTLTQQGAVKFEDYAAKVPGLSLTSARAGLTQVTLRGITTGPAQSASATAYYIDEAPVGSVNAYTGGSNTTPDLDPSDLARLEVLKGPQGTLYGAGAVGGLLKFVTAEPDFDAVTGRVSAGVSSVRKGGTGYAFRGALNVPLVTDTLVVRASGFHRRDAGYIDIVNSPTVNGKDVNEVEVTGGRVLIAAKLGENVRIDLQGIAQDTKVAGSNVVDVDATTLQPLYGDLTQRRFTREPGKITLRLVNGKIAVDLGDVGLLSSTTYQVVKARTAGDATTGFGAALGGIGLRTNQETRVERISQEFRADATGVANGLLDLQLGLYYTHEDDINRIPSFDPFNPATGDALPLPSLAVASILSTYEEYSVFANATVHFGDRFDILVGGRFSHDYQTYDQDYRGLIIGPAPLLYSGTEKGDIFTYLINPRFKISRDAMLYGRIATGYRAGGPNAVPPPALFPGIPTTFEPDKLASYELGFKGAVDTIFTIDAAAFLTNWKNIQIQTSAGGFNFLVNGGNARSKGVEVTARLMPVTGLTLGLTTAFTDAKLTSPAVAAGGLDGDRLPFVPRWGHSLSAQYDWDVAPDWKVNLGAALNYVGKRVSNYADRAAKTVPDYTTINLNAGIEHSGWSLALFAKNLTDKRGITALASQSLTPAGNPFGMAVIQPRTLGAELAFRF
ncbi:TonB-dependent receptor [Sphingopyxis sp. J-6]|uniref:TonB-dependent receptor n=1 Tax=Sphingopyxis sp. J-6 TaxID=3122054 RepID=UPI003984304D